MADSEYASDHIQTVDIGNGEINLLELHAQVVRRNARVELVSPQSDGPCVLISKSELQSLERALEILAATDDVREMRTELSRIIARAGEPMPLFGTGWDGNRLGS